MARLPFMVSMTLSTAAVAASLSRPSFLAAKPLITVSSSFGSPAETSEESLLRSAMPQYLTIAVTLSSSTSESV